MAYDFRSRVKEIFNKAAFISDLGIQIVSIDQGACVTELNVLPKHLQQDGFIHAAVQAAIADHTAGGAGGSLLEHDETILSVEFKINFLRPAIGEKLRCVGRVLKGGKTLTVAESEVFALKNGEEKLVSKATVTLSIVKIKSQASQ